MGRFRSTPGSGSSSRATATRITSGKRDPNATSSIDLRRRFLDPRLDLHRLQDSEGTSMRRFLQFRAHGFLFLMALLPLTGAQCNSVPAPQYKTGPSANVPFIPNVGVTWS